MNGRRKNQEPSFRPYTIAVDTREQSPFLFLDIKADRKDGGGDVIVRTKNVPLKTGDYSIVDHEDRISIERKSMEDLFGCVGNDRKRFEKQLERLNGLPHSFLVVEADWSRIIRGCRNSRLPPKAVYRSVIAWQMNYFPNVHWWFCPGKRMAELTTFRILDRYWSTKSFDS